MILGLVEFEQGTLNKISLEMLTVAQQLANSLATPLTAVLVGAEAEAVTAELGQYGVSNAFVVQHDRLDSYAPEAWAKSLSQLLEQEQPAAILAAGTDRGNEVMAHVAAKLDLPLAANCAEIQPGEAYQLTRMRWGGSLLEEAQLSGSTKLMTVAPHMVAAEAAAEANEVTVSSFTPTLADQDFRVQVTRQVAKESDTVSLTDARVVVSGGRGVGSTEGFSSLVELAELVDGAIGCSRAVTNQGWRPHADQVGQTGARVAPDIYFACGISGAIQHYVGCKGSKNIIVINTDPEAPIIAKADYAVIGDLHEVVPAIAEEIKKLQG